MASEPPTQFQLKSLGASRPSQGEMRKGPGQNVTRKILL